MLGQRMRLEAWQASRRQRGRVRCRSRTRLPRPWVTKHAWGWDAAGSSSWDCAAQWRRRRPRSKAQRCRKRERQAHSSPGESAHLNPGFAHAQSISHGWRCARDCLLGASVFCLQGDSGVFGLRPWRTWPAARAGRPYSGCSTCSWGLPAIRCYLEGRRRAVLVRGFRRYRDDRDDDAVGLMMWCGDKAAVWEVEDFISSRGR